MFFAQSKCFFFFYLNVVCIMFNNEGYRITEWTSLDWLPKVVWNCIEGFPAAKSSYASFKIELVNQYRPAGHMLVELGMSWLTSKCW